MITKENYLHAQREISILSETGPDDAKLLEHFNRLTTMQLLEKNQTRRTELLTRKIAVASTIIWRYEEANKINQIVP